MFSTKLKVLGSSRGNTIFLFFGCVNKVLKSKIKFWFENKTVFKEFHKILQNPRDSRNVFYQTENTN